jgi:putative membrane protein
MDRIFIKWIINSIAIMLAIKWTPGIVYNEAWWGIPVTAAVFGIVNTFIRPFIKLFTLPLLIISLGFFTFIINAMMLSLTSWFSEQFNLGFHVYGFTTAFCGSLIISAVSLFISCLIPQIQEEQNSGRPHP